MLIIKFIFASLMLFFGSKYLKFKDKSLLTASKISLLFCSIIYVFSDIPAIQLFSYLMLIYFIKYFYKTNIKNAVFLWIFTSLLSSIVILILGIIIFSFEDFVLGKRIFIY